MRLVDRHLPFVEAFEGDIKKCVLVLEQGGSLLYPTDTIWGLGCDATNEAAVHSISDIKNRPESKSYLVLMSDTQMLRKHLANPIPDLEGFVHEQEGATTIIYDDIIGMADNILAADGSLGIRIPKDDFCMALLKRFRKPIVSTSANISGEPNPSFYKEISEVVKRRVDYKVNWRREDEESKQPSRIIKLNGDGSVIKIR